MPERNDWYYWTKNQHCHFIQFRDRDDQVARATVYQSSIPDTLRWIVMGPCWTTYQETGLAQSLDEAKEEADKRVMAIIEEEFKPEYVPPLG